MGDHEGHSVLADYLSSIALRRSRCVICCAGNEGMLRITMKEAHVQGRRNL